MYALLNTIISVAVRWQYNMLEIQKNYIILFYSIALVLLECVHGTPRHSYIALAMHILCFVIKVLEFHFD